MPLQENQEKALLLFFMLDCLKKILPLIISFSTPSSPAFCSFLCPVLSNTFLLLSLMIVRGGVEALPNLFSNEVLMYFAA